jgi:hypothetical protein
MGGKRRALAGGKIITKKREIQAFSWEGRPGAQGY